MMIVPGRPVGGFDGRLHQRDARQPWNAVLREDREMCFPRAVLSFAGNLQRSRQRT